MKAMILDQPKTQLHLADLADPTIKATEVLVEVAACGVCRTDLHICDGELSQAKFPLILGHEIIGKVAEIGKSVKSIKPGDYVGIPWLAHTCGECSFCRNNQENLCDRALFTGYTRDGGYAQYTAAEESFCFRIPEKFDPVEAAPLLCAGLIGFRAYRLAGDIERLGIYGFGGAAHILTQIAKAQGKAIYAFTRASDDRGQAFARSLGACWAGASTEQPPETLDAAIIFAPVGALVPDALKAVRKGGVVICGGIHMTDIPAIPYELLWGERIVRSVANLTREDARDFLAVIEKIPVATKTTEYKLEKANEALDDLRAARFDGAAVLSLSS